jgi:hypothetical protein
VADLERELAALSLDDPARKKEDGIAKGKQVIDAAQKAISVADGTIRSIEQGELDPGLRNDLAALPYGGYAIIALSLGFGIWRFIRRRRSDQTLERVVESWNKVVNPLTDEVKAIQGDPASGRDLSEARVAGAFYQYTTLRRSGSPTRTATGGACRCVQAISAAKKTRLGLDFGAFVVDYIHGAFGRSSTAIGFTYLRTRLFFLPVRVPSQVVNVDDPVQRHGV